MSKTKPNSRYRLRVLLAVMITLACLVAFQSEIDHDIARASRPDTTTQGSDPLQPQTPVRTPLSPARVDPFNSEASLPAFTVKPLEVPEPPPLLPTTTVPTLNLQFIGRVTQIDGRETIYMAHGDNTLTITEGMSLPYGYRVDEVTPKHVRLSHPELENPVVLDLPSPPAFEIR